MTTTTEKTYATIAPNDVSRSIAAEARAVEEGHRAFVQPGGRIRIVSDTIPDRHYHVAYVGRGGLVEFCCDHPIVAGWSDQPCMTRPGLTNCKHSALAARRLEREGLARWDNGWYLTERAEHLAAEVPRPCAPPAPASQFVD